MNSNYPSIAHPPSLSESQVVDLYRLATVAGTAILDIYTDESCWQTNQKSDHTPVTAADMKSSDILVSGLPGIYPCPVISEEALPAFEDRSQWDTYWLVDPMDGTREFLHKTDEFVINIALMHHHQPVFGLIYQPTTAQAWWGGQGVGAYFGSPASAQALPPCALTSSVIALGSRRSRWQGEWRDRLAQAGFEFETRSVGSALKFAHLAQGLGDLYPRLGPTSEWDTAAPQAILQATGGAIVQWDGRPLVYGKKNMLNPHFVAVRDKALLAVLVN